ncbi:MAG: choice-of-anchor Q domain-containing protein [Polyangiales bacterium]
MRYLLGLLCLTALSLGPSSGCSDGGENGAGGSGGMAGSGGFAGTGGMAGSGGFAGTGGMAGSGGTGGTTGDVFPCSEQGIRDAIAQGGGPHTFDCVGPHTIVTQDQIIIDNDVVLDGGNNLIVDGNQHHRVFWITDGVTAELRRLAITRGSAPSGGGIFNQGGTLKVDHAILVGNLVDVSGAGAGIHNAGGTVTLTNTTIRSNLGAAESAGGGIYNSGTLTMLGCTVSGNTARHGGGITNSGVLTITNSTLSENVADGGTGSALASSGTATLISITVSGNQPPTASSITGSATMASSLIDGDCAGSMTSNGYNVESPGNTCDLNAGTDSVSVSSGELALGPLQDNGGPTETHAVLAGSVAIDRIPEADCLDSVGQPLTTDQRGAMRPAGAGCEIGSFEIQP